MKLKIFNSNALKFKSTSIYNDFFKEGHLPMVLKITDYFNEINLYRR